MASSTKEAGAKPPGLLWRSWWRFRGWLASRAEASRVYEVAMSARAEAGRAITFEREKAERLVAESQAAQRRAELDSSSAQATIKDREREIELLRREKAAIEGERDLRILEVEELNEWLERHRARVRADTAEEVAREVRATTARPSGPNNAGPS